MTGYQTLRRRSREGEDTLLGTYTYVEAGKLYVYRVQAINEAGVGERSDYVNVGRRLHRPHTRASSQAQRHSPSLGEPIRLWLQGRQAAGLRQVCLS